MEEIAIKTELIDKIEHASDKQLKEIYGLVLNYFNGHDEREEWQKLPDFLQKKIDESIKQAEAGLGTPAKVAIKKAREKYGLNG